MAAFRKAEAPPVRLGSIVLVIPSIIRESCVSSGGIAAELRLMMLLRATCASLKAIMLLLDFFFLIS